MKKYFLFLCLLPYCSFAQNTDKPDYPQHYFRNPLEIPIFLAGNYGECRPAHFHAGNDIKTNGIENQRVHAAADGYISRIKMEKSGYGHSLYITHPNGYTTVYGHLNNFAPAIQKYMKAQQYKQQKWNVDLTVPPSMFPVKKGELIAWSGNTGASTAPHLHFEIRDTKTEHPLNEELFGLPLIDKLPPVPTEIAVYNMNKSIYEQDAMILPLQKKENGYRPKTDTIDVNTNLAGIGVNVNDFMEGSTNTLAPHTMKLYMDDALQAEIVLDDIGFDKARYVNAYSDYKTKKEHGQTIQCLFKLPGNHLDNIYESLNDKMGALALADGLLHHIRIEITDDRDNTSAISFFIRSSGNSNTTTACTDLFKANQPNSFTRPHVSFMLGDKVLYDDICFQYRSTPDANAFSDRYEIHKPYVPAHEYFDLSIRPDKPIPFDLRDKVAMIYSDGKTESGSAATYTSEGWYKAPVRDFGTYWLAADTVAPVIKSLQKPGSNLAKARQITFEVKDGQTSVKKFSGHLDGKWICFEQHNDLFFYKFDEHCPKGKHKLTFEATDENDNTRTFHLIFNR